MPSKRGVERSSSSTRRRSRSRRRRSRSQRKRQDSSSCSESDYRRSNKHSGSQRRRSRSGRKRRSPSRRVRRWRAPSSNSDSSPGDSADRRPAAKKSNKSQKESEKKQASTTKKAESGSRRGSTRRRDSSESSPSQRKLRPKSKQPRSASPAAEKKGVAKVNGDPKTPQLSGAGNASAGSEHTERRNALGDLGELQRQLDEDRNRLQLFVIKAKQEHEELQESKEKREQREQEYYKVELGEPCGPDNRFLLEAELGKGVFSTVYRGKDLRAQGKEFAVKFVRCNPMCKRAADKEIKLMRRLRNQCSLADPEGAKCLLGLAGMEMFEHEGHLAMVLQLMRCDLRSGLRKYGMGHGLPLAFVQSFGRDIFRALRVLRTIKVVHTDLKPDNLLMSLDKTSVRLSDFGSAMDVAQATNIRTDYLQPRYYRAPEVITGQAYSTQIDVWSAGVTLFELATDKTLFKGETNNGMIHEMLKICGEFPKKLAVSGKFASKHFTVTGDFKWRNRDSGKEETIPMSQFPKPKQPVYDHLNEALKKPEDKEASARHEATLASLADLISRCLHFDPSERITPSDALAHAFFNNKIDAPKQP